MAKFAIFTNSLNQQHKGVVLEEITTDNGIEMVWVLWEDTVINNTIAWKDVGYGNRPYHVLSQGNKNEKAHKSLVYRDHIEIVEQKGFYILASEFLEGLNADKVYIEPGKMAILWSKNGSMVTLEEKEQKLYLVWMDGPRPIHHFEFASWGKDPARISGGGCWRKTMDQGSYKGNWERVVKEQVS